MQHRHFNTTGPVRGREDTSGADAGHLVVFDMREGRTWAEKVFRRECAWGGAGITMWGA